MAAAFAIAVAAVGSMTLFSDTTPLLNHPVPSLDVPLGLLGMAGGGWSAHVIAGYSGMAGDWRRWILWIVLPLFLGFGLPALADCGFEWASFRTGTHRTTRTVAIIEKSSSTHRGRRSYWVTVANPVDQGQLDIGVDQTDYDRIVPARGCADLLIEHAPNGAVRLIRAARWKTPCPA